MEVDGVRASFVVTKKDNVVFMSARSVDDVNVQVVMEKLGGGGHANVAGAQFENRSIDDVLMMLKEMLDRLYRAGDI